MTYVLVAENFPEESAEKLKKYGEVVRTRANTRVLRGLDTHPDILVHPLPSGDLVVDRDNFGYYEEIIGDKKIIPSHSSLTGKYPGDILLNAFAFKKIFIHNLKHTDQVILDYYKRASYELVNIKQGYAKCSCLSLIHI